MSGKGQGLHMCTPMSLDRALKAPGEVVYPGACIYILCICILTHPSGLQSLFKYLIVGSSAQATGKALYASEAG